MPDSELLDMYNNGGCGDVNELYPLVHPANVVPRDAQVSANKRKSVNEELEKYLIIKDEREREEDAPVSE